MAQGTTVERQRRQFVPDEGWLAKQAREPIIEPDLPIVDPHHHLWDHANHRYLLDERRVARDPTEHLDSPRPARRLPRTLSVEDAAALVEAPDTTRPDGLRDRALLELLYACGLRASEALGLRVEDVNFAAGYVVVTGKGNRQRLVPAGTQALDWVRRYCTTVRPRLVRREGARGDEVPALAEPRRTCPQPPRRHGRPSQPGVL